VGELGRGVVRERGGGIREVGGGQEFGRLRHIFRDAAAPAEPQATVTLERRADRNFKSTRSCSAVGNADPVGHYDEPRQYRSPQLRDSLIAVKISPDIE